MLRKFALALVLPVLSFTTQAQAVPVADAAGCSAGEVSAVVGTPPQDAYTGTCWSIDLDGNPLSDTLLNDVDLFNTGKWSDAADLNIVIDEIFFFSSFGSIKLSNIQGYVNDLALVITPDDDLPTLAFELDLGEVVGGVLEFTFTNPFGGSTIKPGTGMADYAIFATPIPAGLPLIATGIAAFAAMRLRQRTA